jgi:hypothetical protein
VNVGYVRKPLFCLIISHQSPRYILRDPKLWGDDAEQYNPNRFLPEFNPNAGNLLDMTTITYGFGNRQVYPRIDN